MESLLKNIQIQRPDPSRVMLSITIFAIIIVTLALCLRFYVRLCMIKHVGLDDWMIILAYIFFMIYNVLILIGEHAMARDYLPIDTLVFVFKYMYMCRWWYIVCTTFMKLSVAAMLYRFATKPFYRYLLWILCTTMVVWHTFVFFIYIFQCSPVSHNWDKLVFKPGTCLPNKVMENISYAFSANDIFLNFTFALVPIPLLWNVQMTRKAKYSIYATMSLGCLASIATIIRLKYLTLTAGELDEVWTGMVGSIVCTTLEVALGITAASIASMRPLLKKFDIILTLKSLRQRSQHSHRSKEKGSISLGSLSTSATQNQKPYLREEVSMTEVPLTWQGPAHCPRRCDLYDERGTV